MALSVPTMPIVKTGAVLLTGVVGFAALYWTGLREAAWVGFLAAGLLWSAMGRTSVSSSDQADHPGTASLRPTTLAGLEGHHYTVMPAFTRVTIKARKLRLFTVLAAMNQVSAHVDADPSGQLSVRGSLPVGTFRSGNARRDLHVLGPAFLDADAYPSIRFVSTAVDSTSGDRGAVLGELTVRGRTHPVTWEVSDLAADSSGGTLRAVADTAIRRSDWAMSGWAWLVDDVVSVRVVMLATRTD